VFRGTISFARLDQPDPITTGGGGWRGEAMRDPRYYALPAQLLPRTPATDPLPPYRLTSDYYVNSADIEFLSYENIVIENVQVTPDSSYEAPALDTLYLAYGRYPRQLLQAGEGVNAVMTYYHGSENGPMWFMGCPIWAHQRAHSQAVVDFVLGSMWGMTKNNLTARPAVRAQRVRTAAAGGTTSTTRTFAGPAKSPQRPAKTTTFQRWR
jgi:hypothetical protein